MKVYITAEGRVCAEAESIRDIRKLLALDTSNIDKARAVLATMPAPRHRTGARYTKTHSCGVKYKYLAQHLKKCTENVPITRVS